MRLSSRPVTGLTALEKESQPVLHLRPSKRLRSAESDTFIQNNHGLRGIENGRSTRQHTFTWLWRDCRGGDRYRNCFSPAVKPIRMEALYKRINVNNAYIAEWNLRVTSRIGPEEQIFKAITGGLKFRCSHSRASSFKETVTGRWCPQSNIFFDIGGRWKI